MHDPVRKDVPSCNFRWWLLVPNLLGILRSLFWLWCKILGAGAADPLKYLSRGHRHTFSRLVLPAKRGLSSRHTNYWSHWTHVHMSWSYIFWSLLWWYPSLWGIMRHEIPTWCGTSAWYLASSRSTTLSLLSQPPPSAWIQSSGTLQQQQMFISSLQWTSALKILQVEDGRREGPVRDGGIALHIFLPRTVLFSIIFGGITLYGMIIL